MITTTETDPRTGAGWLSVRDSRTLARAAGYPSHGPDPHQLLHGTDGTLWVANGGLSRDALGRQREGEPIDSSLVRIDPTSGRLQGRWSLPDTQLSIRHMAWSHSGGQLGLALQAEHADPTARAAAPLLAVWDGTRLRLPSADRRGGGYAGDIAAGPGDGFVLSAQKQGRCLWWQPAQPEALTLVAELREPCALVPSPDRAGVSLSAGRGVARWHRREDARMLAWPVALAPDNHWVRLQPGWAHALSVRPRAGT